MRKGEFPPPCSSHASNSQTQTRLGRAIQGRGGGRAQEWRSQPQRSGGCGRPQGSWRGRYEALCRRGKTTGGSEEEAMSSVLIQDHFSSGRLLGGGVDGGDAPELPDPEGGGVETPGRGRKTRSDE